MMEKSHYSHTQRSPLCLVLILFAGLFFVLSLYADEAVATLVLPILGGLFAVLAFSFYSLTVTVTPDILSIRFGPIPLFGTSFELGDIAYATVDTTAIIDGWGIHFIPWRGWTYNLWGFECVRIELGNGRIVRIGTDDSENLAASITQVLQSTNEMK